MVFILSNYLQQVRGYSTLSAGLVFLPEGFASIITSGFLSARLVNRFGAKPIIISGMALQTMAYLLLSSISVTETYIGGLLGPMLLIGIGTGLGTTAINIAALSGTKGGEEGLTSGLINTSRQIGGPIGLAVLLTVANFVISAPMGRLAAVQSASAMILGLDYAFLVAALLTMIGIIFTALLIHERRHSPTRAVAVATLHQN
jgi:MFS family permease